MLHLQQSVLLSAHGNMSQLHQSHLPVFRPYSSNLCYSHPWPDDFFKRHNSIGLNVKNVTTKEQTAGGSWQDEQHQWGIGIVNALGQHPVTGLKVVRVDSQCEGKGGSGETRASG